MRSGEWDNGWEIFLRIFEKPKIRREMAVFKGLQNGLSRFYP